MRLVEVYGVTAAAVVVALLLAVALGALLWAAYQALRVGAVASLLRYLQRRRDHIAAAAAATARIDAEAAAAVRRLEQSFTETVVQIRRAAARG